MKEDKWVEVSHSTFSSYRIQTDSVVKGGFINQSKELMFYEIKLFENTDTGEIKIFSKESVDLKGKENVLKTLNKIT